MARSGWDRPSLKKSISKNSRLCLLCVKTWGVSYNCYWLFFFHFRPGARCTDWEEPAGTEQGARDFIKILTPIPWGTSPEKRGMFSQLLVTLNQIYSFKVWWRKSNLTHIFMYKVKAFVIIFLNRRQSEVCFQVLLSGIHSKPFVRHFCLARTNSCPWISEEDLYKNSLF